MDSLTHPLLDAFTVYGTQLFWPLPWRPVMWASLFIVDPVYTIPLLTACLVAWCLRSRSSATWWLLGGLGLSTGYLGWSLVAKAIVERDAWHALTRQGLQGAAGFFRTDALQHSPLACGRHDTKWVSRRRKVARRRPRTDDLSCLSERP